MFFQKFKKFYKWEQESQEELMQQENCVQKESFNNEQIKIFVNEIKEPNTKNLLWDLHMLKE